MKKMIWATIALGTLAALLSPAEAEMSAEPFSSVPPEAPPTRKEPPPQAVSKKIETADPLAEAGRLAESNPPEAIRLYREGLRLQPEAWESRGALAALLKKHGLIHEAFREYALLVRKAPTPRVYGEYAAGLADAGALNDAAAVAAEGAERFPADVGLLRLAGERFLALGVAPKSAGYFRQAAGLAPGDAGLRAAYGSALERAGKLAEASAAYREALSLDPSQTAAASGRSRLLSRSFSAPGFTLILPEGLKRTAKGIGDLNGVYEIEIVTGLTGGTANAARDLALQGMPGASAPSEMPGGDGAAADVVRKRFQESEGRELSREDAAALVRSFGMPSVRIVTEEVGSALRGSYAGAVWSGFQDGRDTIMRGRHVLAVQLSRGTVAFLLDSQVPATEAKPILVGLLDGLSPAP